MFFKPEKGPWPPPGEMENEMKTNVEYINSNNCIDPPGHDERTGWSRRTYSMSPVTKHTVDQMNAIFGLSKSEIVNNSVLAMAHLSMSIDHDTFYKLITNPETTCLEVLDSTARTSVACLVKMASPGVDPNASL